MRSWLNVSEAAEYAGVSRDTIYTACEPNGAALATCRPAALTERQVAEQLGLSVATLRAWRHRGKGPRFLRLGRSVRYLPANVDEFVRASAVDTQSDSSSDDDSEPEELRV